MTADPASLDRGSCRRRSPLVADGGTGGRPVGEPRRGGAGRRRRGAAASRPASTSSASATTSWRAPTTAGSGAVVLGGHLDTVPANGNACPAARATSLHGLGAADMKGGLAVLLRLAEELGRRQPASTSRSSSTRARRSPTSTTACGTVRRAPRPGRRRPRGPARADRRWIEAGCQGTIHVRATFHGQRAHTARPWMGVNAIHRAAPLLPRSPAHEPATWTSTASRTASRSRWCGRGRHRQQRRARPLRRRREPPVRARPSARRGRGARSRALLDDADEIERDAVSPAAPPEPRPPARRRARRHVSTCRTPKLGWTDVARFAAHGIPAFNFGPGDPELAHTAGERVTRESLEGGHRALAAFLRGHPD